MKRADHTRDRRRLLKELPESVLTMGTLRFSRCLKFLLKALLKNVSFSLSRSVPCTGRGQADKINRPLGSRKRSALGREGDGQMLFL